MHQTDPCGGQGLTGQQAAEQHVGAGLHIAAVGIGLGQVGADQLDGLQGIHVGDGMGLGGDKGLQGMGQGVHPGGGGDMRGQRDGEGRIEDGGLRVQRIAVHPALGLGLFIDEHGGKGDLGSGPGAGGNHDLRHPRFLDLAQAPDNPRPCRRW